MARKDRSRGRDSGSYAVIVRGLTHDGEDFSYAACRTWIEAAAWAARFGVGADAMRDSELVWSAWLCRLAQFDRIPLRVMHAGKPASLCSSTSGWPPPLWLRTE